MSDPDVCAWCRRGRDEHGPPGQAPLGGPGDRLCPVPGVGSQFFTPMPSPPAPRGLTPADLLFAVRVLEDPLDSGGDCHYSDPVGQARAEIALRYHGLTHDTGRASAARLARAEWLGRFLGGKAGG